MTEPTTWTPEARKALREMRSEGVRTDQIARRLGVSVGAVLSQCTRMSLGVRHRTPAEIETILELAGEGATITRIARRCGLDPTVVAGILRRHGIEPRTLPVSYHGDERRPAGR